MQNQSYMYSILLYFFQSISAPIIRDSTECDIHNFSHTYPSTDLESIYCTSVNTIMQIYICNDNITSQHEQLPLSEQIANEQPVLTAIVNLIESRPNAAVIDVGVGNGIYSILVAKLGRKVLAVESNYDTILKFHKAVNLNEVMDKVTLVTNEVGFESKQRTKAGSKNNNDATAVFHINDLLYVADFHEAIMRIDMPFPHRALVYGKYLLSALKIHAIFMNWSGLRAILEFEIEDEENMLIAQMCLMLESMGYWPEDISKTGIERYLDYENVRSWPDHIRWVNAYTL